MLSREAALDTDAKDGEMHCTSRTGRQAAILDKEAENDTSDITYDY